MSRWKKRVVAGLAVWVGIAGGIAMAQDETRPGDPGDRRVELAQAHWLEEGMRWYLGEDGARARDIEKAKEAFRNAAERGAAEGWFALARIAQEEGDLEEAKRLYEKASSGGYAKAEHNLAVLLRETGDAEGALRHLRRAAAMGVPESQRDLAVIYHMGLAGERDLVEAAFWYERVWTQAKDPQAAYGRALVAEERNEDPAVAREWFRRAAEGGVAQAMSRYGFYLGAGRGGEPNLPAAREWLRKAQEHVQDAAEQRRIAKWIAAIDAEVLAAAGTPVKPESLANAVAVSPEGWLVAPAVAVEQLMGRELRVWLPPATYVMATVEDVDEQMGLALLRTSVRTPRYVAPSANVPAPGATLVLVGHKKEVSQLVPTEIDVSVARVGEVRGRKEYVLKAMLPTHFYGAPLVDEEGLVGVLVPWDAQGRVPNMMRAVAASEIWARWGDRLAQGKVGLPGDVRKAARAATARVMAEPPRIAKASTGEDGSPASAEGQ